MSYLIKYSNGAYNWGSGHEVEKKEATRYSTQEQAYAIAKGIVGEALYGIQEIEYVSDTNTSTGRTIQRQDSVTDQLYDLVNLANQNGMYDAADWIMDRLGK
jgi:hypothetical protein